MRGSRLSLFLALSILVLLAAAGTWLLHRGGGQQGVWPTGAGPGKGAASSRDGHDARGTVVDSPEELTAQEGDTALDPTLDPAAPPASMEGKVTDAMGNAVAGARVLAVERRAVMEAISKDQKLLDRAPLQALRAFHRSLAEVARRLPSSTTTTVGTYALRGLPDGDHRIIVTHADFLAYGEEDWILVEAGATARCDVELAAGHGISGLVRDGEGAPVAGAEVRAAPVESSRLRGLGKLVQVFIDQSEGAVLLQDGPVMTDALGAFRLRSLRPGGHDLRIVKEGYAWGEASDVAAGTEDLIITLERAVHMKGHVVSRTGEPIAGAAILLREPERDLDGPAGPLALAFADVDLFGEREREGATDEEGQFTLAIPFRGAYDLAIRAQGFPERRREVTLDGAPIELGDIVLDDGREIAGTVLSPAGSPVAGADVWVPMPAAGRVDRDSRRLYVLKAGPSWSIASVETDARGAFRLAGLGGDSQEVAVRADGHPEMLLEGVAVGGRSVTITLERGLTIRGRIVDAESREALAGARVGVERGQLREEGTDVDGRFELRGVGLDGGQTFGGSITILVSLEGFREARETVVVPDPVASPVADVELELRRLGPGEAEHEVSGFVRDAHGEPIAGALVWTEVPGWPSVLRHMEPRGSAPKETRTSAGGAFSVRAPQIGGTIFEVVASHPGLATSRAGPFPQHPGEAGWPLVEIRLDEGVTIEGRVTSLDGAPLAGARVRIWRDSQVPEEATVFTRILPQATGELAYSTKDGMYRLRRIQPGSYRVETHARGYAGKAIGPVEVGARGTPVRIDVALDPGGSIEGRVVDPAGKPIAGIEVVAFPIAAGSGPLPDEEDEFVQTGALGAAVSATGRNGDYRIEHLPTGEARVLARARGFEAVWITSAVPNESVPDLVLAPHARITGRVREAETGAPPGPFTVKLDRRDADGTFSEDPSKARAVDDPEGRFACEGLRAGEWRARVTAPGRAPWQRAVSLEPGDEIELDVALSAGRRIEGVVRRPDGAPVAGATITVRRDGDGQELESIQSGTGGEFAIGGLEEGSYHLHAIHPEHYAEPGAGAVKVDLSAAEDAGVEFELRPAGKVLGRVRGLVFEPPGIDIFVVTFSATGESPPGPSFQVWVVDNGKVRMDSVRPGRYRLELTHRRNAPDTGGEWISVPPEIRPLGEVEIRAGEMATFEVEAR